MAPFPWVCCMAESRAHTPAGSAQGEHSKGWKGVQCAEKTVSCGKVRVAPGLPQTLQPLYRCDTTGKYKSGLFDTELQQCQQTQLWSLLGVEGPGLLIFNSKQVTSIMIRVSWIWSPPGSVLSHQFIFYHSCELCWQIIQLFCALTGSTWAELVWKCAAQWSNLSSPACIRTT